jgi:hypothetical protein
MKTLILGLAIIMVCAFILMRPHNMVSMHRVKTIDADPPSRESRPMPYPRDTMNTDKPVLMKDIRISAM